jgi:S-sulfosulfanyl-L-cysteine sulfohydrolase
LGRQKVTRIKSFESNRREFLKKASRFGLSFGVSNILPSVTSAFSLANGFLETKKLSVQNGKAHIISLLHTTDIHAQLFTHDELFVENGKAVYKKRGGFAVLKTMINTLREQNPNSIVIDGGDCFQGSGLASLTNGEAIVPLINNIGYDLMLPGNWEVVYGKEMLVKDMAGYNGAKICANMFHQTNDAQNGESIFPPFFVKELAGIKLGFIGYNDPLTPKRQSPAYSNGIKFTSPEYNLEKYVKALREDEKCHLIFLVTHMGLTQQVDLANKPFTKGVDFILGADTHERVRQPIQGVNSKVTEPGAFGSFVGKLDIVVEDGVVKDQSYHLLDVDPELYKEDEEMNVLIKKVREPYRKELDRVIGKTKSPLVRYYILETPMDNFITDAIRWKFKPDIAFSNGFRFCPPLVPDPSKGYAEITKDFLWSMLPVNSEAKQGVINGKQLWDWFERELENAFAKNATERFGGWLVRFSGMEVNITVGNEFGKRVNYIKVKGQPIDLKKNYTFVACEREGDPDSTICRHNNVHAPKRLGKTLHGVIEEYLALHSPISPTMDGRISATDAPVTLLTQSMGFDYEFR